MTKQTTNYLDALHQLGLTSHGVHTAAVLGLKVRQLSRLAGGASLPSATLERLLVALLELKRLRRKK